jgi:hypothetical protein
MLGQLMKNRGLELPEHLIFGLAEGLDFRWTYSADDFFLSGKSAGQDIINRLLNNQNLNLTVKMVVDPEELKKLIKPEIDRGNYPGIRIHKDSSADQFEKFRYYTLLGYEDDQLQVLSVNREVLSLSCSDLEKEIKSRSELFLYFLEGIREEAYAPENRYLHAIRRTGSRYKESGYHSFQRYIDFVKQARPLMKKSLLTELRKNLPEESETGPLYRKYYNFFLRDVYEMAPVKRIETSLRILSDINVYWEDVQNRVSEKNLKENLEDEDLPKLLQSIADNELHLMDVLVKK